MALSKGEEVALKPGSHHLKNLLPPNLDTTPGSESTDFTNKTIISHFSITFFKKNLKNLIVYVYKN